MNQPSPSCIKSFPGPREMSKKHLCLNTWHKRRERRRGWGWTVDYFWKLPTQNAPFWPELLHACSRWRSCSSCPTATSVPTVPTPALGPSQRPSLSAWGSHPVLFWPSPAPCRAQNWVLALSQEFTGMKAGHQLSQRGAHVHNGCRRHNSIMQRWMCHKTPPHCLLGHWHHSQP